MMAFKNTVVFATLLLSLLVGAVALTEEEEQLLADLQKKKAEEEFKKASPSGPQIRTERGEDGGSDVMFIVDEGSKVGMQVGDEKTYFNVCAITQTKLSNFLSCSSMPRLWKLYPNSITM
eukprot:m.133443 g.133443  ORF g.133443 m.133443 type:complete len:120 (-) comp14673_c1_seq1:4810-5169(-)